MDFMELGDIVTLGFTYNGHPPMTPFVVSSVRGAHECIVNDEPSVMAFKLEPLNGMHLVEYRYREAQGTLAGFSLTSGTGRGVAG